MHQRLSIQMIMPLALLLLGIAIIWHVNTVFVADNATHTGPLDDSGLFPRIVGYALAGLSLITLIQQLFRPSAQDVGEMWVKSTDTTVNQFRAFGILLTMVIYVAVLRWLGYAIATPLMLTVACLILRSRLIWALFLAIVGSFMMSVIFERVLNVQLPLGTLF